MNEIHEKKQSLGCGVPETKAYGSGTVIDNKFDSMDVIVMGME